MQTETASLKAILKYTWKDLAWKTPMRSPTASPGDRTAGYTGRRAVPPPPMLAPRFPKMWHFWGRPSGGIIRNQRCLRYLLKEGGTMLSMWRLTAKEGFF